MIDLLAFSMAICGAFSLRFDTFMVSSLILEYWKVFIVLLPLKLFFFYLCGMYRSILRYSGLDLLYRSIKGVALSSGLIIVISYLFELQQFPRSILLIDMILTLLLSIGFRIALRWIVYDLSQSVMQTPCERIIIYGAGSSGVQLANVLRLEKNYSIICFVDDNRQLQKQMVNGITVKSPEDLPTLIQEYAVNSILLAIPSASRVRRKEILEYLKTLGVTIKTIPGLGEIVAGRVTINDIREIDIIDLLGRKEVQPVDTLLHRNVSGKVVLITGAGGSIGSEMCRQVAQLDPELLIMYELNELALYSIEMELSDRFPHLNKKACLGSITDQKYFSEILEQNNVQTIYHAAAYKHVPLVEANPAQGVLNNIRGTLRIARAAMAHNVQTFVLISTDKAVRPTNVMGTTKRCTELILQALNSQQGHNTCFVMVRFGNVLNSAGSVVPRFRKLIKEGKPITVTHPEVTRYFMSIPEASRLVIQAGAMGKGGDVFLLDMGEPIKIYDLATQMIELCGLTPGKDIEIIISGLRPGEKLYEELLVNEENVMQTEHSKIFSSHENMLPWQTLHPLLEQLFEAAENNDSESIIKLLKVLVPEYTPKKHCGGTEALEPSVGSGEEDMDCPAEEFKQLQQYIVLRQTDQAEVLLNELNSQLPKAVQFYFQGAIAGDRGDNREALKSYLQALSHLQDSNLPQKQLEYIKYRATRAMAITKCKLGEDFQGALNTLQELSQEPFVLENRLYQQQQQTTKAVVHYYNGDYENTICLMQMFMDSNTCQEDNHTWLSQACLFTALSAAKTQQKDMASLYFKKALKHFLKLEEAKVNNPNFLFGWIGWVPLVKEFQSIYPEMTDQILAAELMQQSRNGFILYQGLCADSSFLPPQCESVRQNIIASLDDPIFNTHSQKRKSFAVKRNSGVGG